MTRVAAWQCRPGTRDLAGNLQRLDPACASAAARGAQVLVTPEMFTSGYALAPGDLRHLAEDPGGPTEAAVAAIARRHGIAVVYGHPERAPGGGTGDGGTGDGRAYNAATMIGADGAVLGRHRKIRLFGEHDRRLFLENPEPPAAFGGFGGIRVGMLICYDVEFGEPVRCLAADGARAILVPTANMTGYQEVPRSLVRARARENGCGVVYANYCGADEAFAYGGLSVICGPAGEVLAQAGPADEELLIADLFPP